MIEIRCNECGNEVPHQCIDIEYEGRKYIIHLQWGDHLCLDCAKEVFNGGILSWGDINAKVRPRR